VHPAPSIIFFTTASGAGYGLLFLLALGGPAGLVPSGRWLGLTGLGLALGLITAGLLASTLHLKHPERAWRAVSQWRSSWLSREGLAALVTFPPALLLALGWVWFERTRGPWAVAGVLTALLAVATVWCTGMIYASLKPIREWHQPLVPWLYLAFALMTGALLLHALLLAFAAEARFAGILALLLSPLAFGLKALYWQRIAALKRGLTPGRATGLEDLGRVRLVEPPHTQTNYLLTEMGYRVGRKHADQLRLIALTSGLGAPLVLTLGALMTGGLLAALLALGAAIAGLVGVAVERWLFFAEATHTMTLYYGRDAA
jgi:DMSO reductase anchor subunit